MRAYQHFLLIAGEQQAGKEHVGHDFQAALIESALKRKIDQMDAKEENEEDS